MNDLFENPQDEHTSTFVSDISPHVIPNWCAFALGGMVTFLLVYIGIARPAAHEFAQLRRHMGTLEQSVWEIAGHGDDVRSTNSLLELLAEQKAQLSEARQAAAEMRELQEQLVMDSDQIDQSMVNISQLVALKDMLLSNADRADQAAAVLALTEDLQHRMANAIQSSELALVASKNLLELQSEVLAGSVDATPAREALQELVALRDDLSRESLEVGVARAQIDDLISLKDQVVSQTQDLEGAIETLSLTREMGRQFQVASATFDEMRHWMLEIASAEPLLRRAIATIQPLLEVGKLDRLAPDALRAVAREVVGQQPRVAHRIDGDDSVVDADD